MPEDEEEHGEQADRDDRDRGQRDGEERPRFLLGFGPVGANRLLVLLPTRGLDIEVVEVVGHVTLPVKA